MKPKNSIIVAMSENRVIGEDGGIPWKIPCEQKRFKEITMGHPIIMGRKTYESIGRVLPGRTNIIVTTDVGYHVEGAVIVHSLEEGIERAKEFYSSSEAQRSREASNANSSRQARTINPEIFIVGGGKLFGQALSYTDRLYLTVIHKNIEGDAFFPDYAEFKTEISREDHEFEDLHYSYITLER